MILATIVACGAVITLMVVNYERRLSKTKKYTGKLYKDNRELAEHASKTVFDYNVLVSILEDRFEVEEIDEMFAQYKEELIIKNGGSDRYEGKFFSKQLD